MQLCLGAAGFAFLQECEELLVNTLVALDFETEAPELHLQQMFRMTRLASLSLRGNITADMELPAGDRLTLLHSLADLCSLDLQDFRIQQPNMDIQELRSLLNLSSSVCLADSCDLTSCTQNTSLAVTSSMPSGHVILPTSSNVQLQHLSVSADCDSPPYFQKLKNLQDATKLTSIDFDDIILSNLDEGGWPVSLPHWREAKDNTM